MSTVKQLMSKNDNHREKSLISMSRFAKRKKVSRQAVQYQVTTTKAIIPVLIGYDKDIYIDWEQYKDFAFNHNKANNNGA